MTSRKNDKQLHSLYFDNKKGFPNLRNLIKSAREHGIDRNYVKDWYNRQTVNQIIVNRKQPIAFHITIGDGNGYQMDITFLPNPRLSKGYIGMLSFNNTSTRKAYIAKIKDRTTESLILPISVWIDHVNSTGEKYEVCNR